LAGSNLENGQWLDDDVKDEVLGDLAFFTADSSDLPTVILAKLRVKL
jgi:hypothetical protein